MATLSKLLVELGLDSAGFAGGLGIATGALGKFGGGIKAIGGVIAGAAVLDGVKAIGTGLFDIGSQWDSVNDSIQTKTGATGKTLDGLASTAKEVFKSVPVSMETAGDAVGQLNQLTGATGKTLEDLATKELNLSRITGTDLNTNITATTGLFKAWNVSTADQGKTLDALFATSQKTGVGVAELSAETAQYGPVLKTMGLSVDQGISFLGKMGKAGVNTGVVMSGLKKSIGVFSKAGVSDIKGGLTDVFNGITHAGSSAKATAIAMKYFGAKAGPEIAKDILEGKLSIDDLTAAMGDSKDAINKTASQTDDFSQKWQVFKNNLTAALIPLGTGLFNALNALIPLLTTGAAGITGFIAGLVSFVSAVTLAFNGTTSWTDLLTRVPGWLQPITLGLIEIVSGLGKLYRGFQDNGIQGFVDAFSAGWQQISNGLGDLLSGIVGALGSIGSSLLDAFVGLPWGDIASAGWNLLVDAIKMDAKVAIKLGSLLVDVAGWIPGAIPDIWEWFTGHVFGSTPEGDGTSMQMTKGFTLKDVAVNVANWIPGAIVDLGAWLLPILVKSVQDLTDLGARIASAVGEKFSGIDWKSAITIDSANLGVVVGAAIRGAIAQAFDITVQAAQALYDLDWSSVPGKIADAIKVALIAGPGAITGIAIAIASFIGGAIAGLVFGPDVDFGSVVTKIQTALTTAANAAVDGFKSIGSSLISGIMSGWTERGADLEAFATGLPGWIVGKIGDVSSTLRPQGVSILTGFWNGANDIWDNFSVWATTRGTVIISLVGDLGSTLLSAGKALISGFYGSVIDGWTIGGVAGWFSDRGSHIISLVGDLGSILYGAGADAVQGLINGAVDKIPGLQSVINTLKSLFEQIKNMGNSPWPMMIEAGQDAVDGLIVGGKSRLGALASTVDDVIGIMTPPPMGMAFAGISGGASVFGMAGSSSGASASPQVTNVNGGITIHVTGNSDPKATADEVFAVFSRQLGLRAGV